MVKLTSPEKPMVVWAILTVTLSAGLFGKIDRSYAQIVSGPSPLPSVQGNEAPLPGGSQAGIGQAQFTGPSTTGIADFTQCARAPDPGQTYNRARIPEEVARPAEGPRPDQRWQFEADRQPLASFVTPLQGTDAVIEIILGQSRLLGLKTELTSDEGTAVVAVGDPTVAEFEVLPNARMIRLLGNRVGVTDLSITSGQGETYTFELHVIYDLRLLQMTLRQTFPDAYVKLSQLREHLVVEGQARSAAQVSQIMQFVEAYLASVQVPKKLTGKGGPEPGTRRSPVGESNGAKAEAGEEGGPAEAEAGSANGQANWPIAYAGPESGEVEADVTYAAPQVINLLRIPGAHQVMLQVRIAELNRTGLREIGADVLWVDPRSGTILGTQIAGAAISALGLATPAGLTGTATGQTTGSTTGFGVFPSPDLQILLRALRQNKLLSILAEPNLMAMNGQRASFLAGGEFPVPVPQTSGGLAGAITIQYKDFGVQLNFVPYILEDESIRLSVAPEVSTIDESLGVTVLGTSVPGLNTRRAATTVELREGQTLAIAGLLQVSLDAETSRIPGLGDLPYIGPMFSNTGHERVEKELLVLVTPYLVRPMEPDEVPCVPGEDIEDPNDLEFYLLNRIEGRTGRKYRAVTGWDDPHHMVELFHLESRYVNGPCGFGN